MALFDSSGNVSFSGIGSFVGSLGNAAQDLMSGKAYEAQAESDIQVANDYAKVATLYGQEQNITAGSGAIQLGQEQRQINKVTGQQEAAAGKAGVSSGGSAGDIMRDTLRQGALAKMTITGQTAIQEQQEKIGQQAALTQEDAAVGAAKAAQASAGAAGIGAVFSIASGLIGLL